MARKLTLTLALALGAALAAGPASAQDAEPGDSLMDRGMRLFFEGLMQEMEPAIGEFQKMAREFGPAFLSFAEEMGPALTAIMEKVEDWSAYHPPEMLDNGDIIIRRKTPAERIAEGEEIDL